MALAIRADSYRVFATELKTDVADEHVDSLPKSSEVLDESTLQQPEELAEPSVLGKSIEEKAASQDTGSVIAEEEMPVVTKKSKKEKGHILCVIHNLPERSRPKYNGEDGMRKELVFVREGTGDKKR